MALRLWHGYGIINVKVEEIDGAGNVVSTLAPSILMYLPIKVYSQNPLTSRIDSQPYGYYAQFFNDYTFLGSNIVPYYNQYNADWNDINVSLENMSHYCPLTRTLYPMTYDNRIKVTDIGSGNYYITTASGRRVTFYWANGTSMGSYQANGTVPFSPGETNIYSVNWCITAYTQEGATCTVTGVASIGCRGVSNNKNAVYGVWNSTSPNVNSVRTWINNVAEFIPPEPYSQGGNTDVSEMTGDFDGTSDPVDFPSLPSLGATDTGLITLYNPSLAEVRNLATYMWTNPAFDISVWKKIFANPIDAILGLSIVPVAVPDGGVRPIAVGNLATDVNMNVAAQQYIELQCGSLNVNEFWSSYLDYDPFTKAEIYLPYCGIHQLSVDDIMGKTVEVRYHIDILTGSCCAYVKCGDSVLYQFIGQCSSSIPVASGDFSEIVDSALNAALAVGSVIATGGASAPFALTSYTSNAVNMLKEKIQKSGSLSGSGGMLAIQKPYLILTRPRQAVPANQNHYTGYPSFITENLSDLIGYTEIERIHLENVSATDSELNEITTLLEGGVIF